MSCLLSPYWNVPEAEEETPPTMAEPMEGVGEGAGVLNGDGHVPHQSAAGSHRVGGGDLGDGAVKVSAVPETVTVALCPT